MLAEARVAVPPVSDDVGIRTMLGLVSILTGTTATPPVDVEPL
jgi:hypothetical protein